MMKKINLCLLFLMLLGILFGCDNSKTNPETQIVNTDMVNITDGDVAYKVRLDGDKKTTIIDRRQVPQLMLSTLLRTDLLMNADFMTPEEMDDYFAICKETGMNTIEIVIMWSQIETAYNVYDFSDVEVYLNYAKKYDLKLNIEWYGSLTDGETHTANIPEYVSKDTKTYPIIEDLFDFANYGRCRIMDYANPNLLKREGLALYKLMNYIGEWNQRNNLYDPVIMVQIGQGADRFQRWRIDAYKITGEDNNLLASDVAWKMVHTYLNEISRAVKYSGYKALTRAEFCEQVAVVNYVRDVKDLEFIDIVAPTYLHEVSQTKSGIKSFVDTYGDMPVVNVENWANDINYRQVLATIAMGGVGYVSYQLSSPIYFPESPNGTLYNRYNPEGATLAEKFVERNTRATDTKQINLALTKAFVPASNATRANFAAFGLDNLLNSQTGDERIQKIYMTNGLMFEYSNPEDATGFAIYDDKYVYVYSSKNAKLTITNCSITVAQKGYFASDATWVNEGVVALESNSILTIEQDVLYRVRIASINELPKQTELTTLKYKGTLDSIRG